MELAGGGDGEIALRLPYLDRKEWRKRGQILAALPLERRGNLISAIPEPSKALRDAAAHLALAHPAWLGAPGAGDSEHFAVWQNVSVALQRYLRSSIPEQYFSDIERYQDRKSAYPMLVYQAAHVYRAHSHGEFTYNLSDYPRCRLTVALAMKKTGIGMYTILGRIEQQLNEAGFEELARRYAPVWYEDVLVAVRTRPKTFIPLLVAESAFIQAVIELSLNRTPSGVHSFSRAANQALRSVYGMDVRPLGVRALAQATAVLEAAGGINVERRA